MSLTLYLQYLLSNKMPTQQQHLLFKTLDVVSARQEKLHYSLIHQQNSCLEKFFKKAQVTWEDTAATGPVANIPSGTPSDAFISFPLLSKADI